ncbi:MAG: M15 family metallopeptidase [Aeromonas sp.]
MRQAQLLGFDESHLIPFGRTHHQMTPNTAAAFNDLQVKAAYHGFNLQAVSCWRSFERQLAIWNAKWRGERPVVDDQGQPLDMRQLSELARLHAILRYSALPGTSRHHWGTDLDVYDPDLLPYDTKLALEPWEYEEGGHFSELCEWLVEWMSDFGFHQPYPKPELAEGESAAAGVGYEPWHLSFTFEAAECVLDPEALRHCLAHAEIEGKASILAHLDEILTLYVAPAQAVTAAQEAVV